MGRDGRVAFKMLSPETLGALAEFGYRRGVGWEAGAKHSLEVT